MAYNYGNYYPTPMNNFSPQYSQTPMNNMPMNNMQMQPQQQVQNLLNSGQMTQEQFNNLSNMATQFKEMLK